MPKFACRRPSHSLLHSLLSSNGFKWQALEGGLGLSLFERLQQAGLTPHLLNVQYRMHPAIAEFPSAAFYNSRVTSHPQPQDRPAPAGNLFFGNHFDNALSNKFANTRTIELPAYNAPVACMVVQGDHWL